MLAETIAMLLLTMQASGSQGAAANRQARAEDPDRLICRAPRPVLGSRVARRRECRTAAQWQSLDVDRNQLQRDLQNTPSPVATDF